MGVQLNNQGGQFDAFTATETRRRLLKQQMEDQVSSTTKEIIVKLISLSNCDVPECDPEKEKLCNTLKDTFNAFDNDGSAQLSFDEYADSWNFLNRPGKNKIF